MTSSAEPRSTAIALPRLHRYSRWASVVIVAVLGLGVTGLVTWGARDNYDHTESRLLQLQTEQAAAVLKAAAAAAATPLQTAAEGAALTDGRAVSFVRAMSPLVGVPGGYVVAQLWVRRGVRLHAVAALGPRPAISATSNRASVLVSRSLATATFAVAMLVADGPARLGYVYALHGTRFVVYAEQALPRPGATKLQRSNAFSELGFAIFFGRTVDPSALLAEANTKVPLGGRTARVQVRFGSGFLTLQAVAIGSLAGSLAAAFPWIFGSSGLVLTAIAVLIVQQTGHRRRLAESDAIRSRELSGALAHLYAEQRTIAETLQRSLLPVRNPTIGGVDVAARYVAGASGSEIGGDWYSLLALDASRYAFAIGDVSGRGFQAASVMAALRYTTRTLLLEGHAPHVVLERCAHHVRDQLRGHFATVLVGLGDVERHQLALANAGHLPPLVVTGAGFEYASLPIGPPLGVDGGSYASATIETPPGTTFLAYTDGLVERRHEHLDVGLSRLGAAASSGPADVDALLTAVITELTQNTSEDDIAILALRFR